MICCSVTVQVIQHTLSVVEVSVAIPQCRNTLLQVKVLHSKSYLSKITGLTSKYVSSTRSKSTYFAEWSISELFLLYRL